MPIQIKMNTNLSNRSYSTFAPTSQNKSVSLASSSSSKTSKARFQKPMIDRVHLSKPGCSSCGH